MLTPMSFGMPELLIYVVPAFAGIIGSRYLTRLANFCLMVVVFQFDLAVLLTAGIPQPWTTHAVVISPNNLRIGRQPYSAAGLYLGCDRGLSASTLCQSMRHIGCNNSSRLSNGSLT